MKREDEIKEGKAEDSQREIKMEIPPITLCRIKRFKLMLSAIWSFPMWNNNL